MECKKLITARKNKGLTQKQVADKMAMEQTTYSKKERGLSPIREDEWMRFAKILEVNIEDIKEIRTQKEKKKNNELNSFTLKTLKKYVKKLEEENATLKNQLKTLTKNSL